MALTVIEFLRAVIPNIGLIANDAGDGYRIGVEDINSDEVLTAVEALNTALQAGGITQAQLAAILAAIEALETDIILAGGTAVIGRVGHDSTGIGHGVETCDSAGTGQAIVTSSTPAKRVNVQAQTDNTDAIAVGASAAVDAAVATGNGLLLSAGDWSDWINVTNLNQVFFDALVTGEGVRFMYET